MSAEQSTYVDKAPEFLRGILNTETRTLDDVNFQMIGMFVGDAIRLLDVDTLRYVTETWERLQIRLTDVQAARLHGIADVAYEGLHITPELTEEEAEALRPWGELARKQQEYFKDPTGEYPSIVFDRDSVPTDVRRLQMGYFLGVRRYAGKVEPMITPRGENALALFDLKQSGQLATDLGIKSIPQPQNPIK